MNDATNQSKLVRAVLGASGVAAMAWWACGQLVAPSIEREKADRSAITSLQERIERARIAIREVQALESGSAAVHATVAQLEKEMPAQAAKVGLPELVKQQFGEFGLSVAIVRMNAVREEPVLPGYSRGFWSVAVPIQEGDHSAAGSLLAAAEFEQRHPFVKVVDFAIRPDPENPSRRIALLNVAALIRQ